jgi:hypothetical protein
MFAKLIALSFLFVGIFVTCKSLYKLWIIIKKGCREGFSSVESGMWLDFVSFFVWGSVTIWAVWFVITNYPPR